MSRVIPFRQRRTLDDALADMGKLMDARRRRDRELTYCENSVAALSQRWDMTALTPAQAAILADLERRIAKLKGE